MFKLISFLKLSFDFYCAITCLCLLTVPLVSDAAPPQKKMVLLSIKKCAC